MNILFVTHETTRTGAPHVILYFMEWLKEHHPEHKRYVISLTKGEISTSFKQLSHGFLELDDLKVPQSVGLKKQLLQKTGLLKKESFEKKWKHHTQSWHIDLIYANTVVSIPFSTSFKRLMPTAKIIAHVHELEAVIKLKLPQLASYNDQIAHFIAPAPLIASNLVKNHAVLAEAITSIPECTKISAAKVIQGEKQTSKEFIVGGSGTVHWRKGTDLFIQVARVLQLLRPDLAIKFLWLGHLSKTEEIIINEDLEKSGIRNVVTFVGAVENPHEYYNQMDLFLMTSREDPFPLVCLEVGMLGKPIIYFDKAIGTQYVLENAGGKKVPYLDVHAMAATIIEYYNNRSVMISDGLLNKEAFSKFSPALICPLYYEVCEKVLSND